MGAVEGGAKQGTAKGGCKYEQAWALLERQ